MSTQYYAPQQTPPPSMPRMRPAKWVPEPGKRNVVTLDRLPGRLVPSTFGANEVVLEVAGGHPWYVPQFIADTIYKTGVCAGDQIEVTVTGRKKTDLLIVPVQTRIAPAGETAARTASAPPPAPPQSPAPLAPPPSSSPAAGIQTQRMMASFVVAIDAIAEAQAHLQKRGLGITLTADNITSAALSVYINACREGR